MGDQVKNIQKTKIDGSIFLKRPGNYVYLAGTLFYIAIFVKNAWVSEDAYILFRSIEQLFAGNGPVWNPHERVQVFTSPLWYFLNSFVRMFSHDVYINCIILSLLLCLGVMYVLKHLVNDPMKWLCIVLLLASSKGFFDFTSSGIENALGYFLLALFLFYIHRLQLDAEAGTNSYRDCTLLLLCFGLLLICRHDLLMLIFPSALLVYWEHRRLPKKKLYRLLVAGLLPIILWSLFSLLYYGFPFPNTAYAKLHTGIPRVEVWAQGGKYFLSSLQHDSVTLTATAVATTILTLSRNRYALSVAGGILLHLFYIMNVGGDFMQGRFLSYAYLVSICAAFTFVRISTKVLAGIMIGCLVYWLSFADNPVSAPTNYNKSTYTEAVDKYGIADERGYYFPYSSIWAYIKQNECIPFPNHPWSIEGLKFRLSKDEVSGFSNIGFYGYWAGTRKVIIDPFALSNPFLARLPAITPWRIGHFFREFPEGYWDSVLSGRNMLKDPRLRHLYGEIQNITQGPLWRKERLFAIVMANLDIE